MALNNSQYDTIIRTYEQKQLHNRNILDKRYETVYNKIPEMNEINQKISYLSVKQARKLLEGDEHALMELKAQIRELSNQKVVLLANAGFPANYLEPVYDCPDCKDTGYIDNQKCHCFQKAVIDLLYTQSNLKSILQKENFDTFSFRYYSENHVDPKTGRSSLATMQKAYQTARDFVDTFSKEFRNLFLYGDTGVGKTFLSNCIAKELIDRSYSVIYFSAFELFDTLAKSRFGKDDAADQMYEHIFDCDLLIIDDLGTELANTLTTSQLFLCVNERLSRRKSTIISTNLSVETMRHTYSERTFSRITSNYTMLKLTGDDIRIKKKLMNREEN
ncbi:MAG: ATP-binding protein [Tyzzerella sp.]|nr:ATP-binding protein [Tyzzerella sp.]